MLTINDLTFRIDGRALFEGASAQIADGWKVGLVGRNGTGKSTLLRIIREELAKGEGNGDGSVRINRGAKMGFVLQEVPANDQTLLDVVLEADIERASLMREADTCEDPDRIGEIHDAARRHRRVVGRSAGGGNSRRPRLHAERPVARVQGILRRLAHARGARRRAVCAAGTAAAGRADQLSRS